MYRSRGVIVRRMCSIVHLNWHFIFLLKGGYGSVKNGVQPFVGVFVCPEFEIHAMLIKEFLQAICMSFG